MAHIEDPSIPKPTIDLEIPPFLLPPGSYDVTHKLDEDDAYVLTQQGYSDHLDEINRLRRSLKICCLRASACATSALNRSSSAGGRGKAAPNADGSWC